MAFATALTTTYMGLIKASLNQTSVTATSLPTATAAGLYSPSSTYATAAASG